MKITLQLRHMWVSWIKFVPAAVFPAVWDQGKDLWGDSVDECEGVH